LAKREGRSVGSMWLVRTLLIQTIGLLVALESMSKDMMNSMHVQDSTDSSLLFEFHRDRLHSEVLFWMFSTSKYSSYSMHRINLHDARECGPN
jgi:hypothetical protein